MRDGRRILDADGHVIEPGGIFGGAQRADHNPITMSRMSRLFGVTMAERGVSQLVSVDLEGAVKIRDQAVA